MPTIFRSITRCTVLIFSSGCFVNLQVPAPLLVLVECSDSALFSGIVVSCWSRRGNACRMLVNPFLFLCGFISHNPGPLWLIGLDKRTHYLILQVKRNWRKQRHIPCACCKGRHCWNKSQKKTHRADGSGTSDRLPLSMILYAHDTAGMADAAAADQSGHCCLTVHLHGPLNCCGLHD